MKTSFLCFALALMVCSCEKNLDPIISPTDTKTISGFTQCTIKQGQHFSGQNKYKPVAANELKFSVLFDSSAIYKTILPENQYDINKLYGFSDNNTDHHQSSARLGWRWNANALELFAYVYNQGIVSYKELTTIELSVETMCSIKVSPDYYLFTVNNYTDSLSRLSCIPILEAMKCHHMILTSG
jgi:hypothetical protein